MLRGNEKTSFKVYKRRFTLVELLVMIALICILSALLMPALQKTLLEARLVACTANLRTQFVGIQTYADSYNGHMPAPWPERNAVAYLNDRTSTDVEIQSRGIGLGALISNGLLNSAEVVLCPDNISISAASMQSINTALKTGAFNANISTQTTYLPNSVYYPYQGPVIYSAGRSYYDWANRTSASAQLGVASRIKGNLPGGILSHIDGAGLYIESRLSSPRGLITCAMPDFNVATEFIPHQNYAVNVLFADGVIQRCESARYPEILLNENIATKFRDYLNKVYPGYLPPR